MRDEEAVERCRRWMEEWGLEEPAPPAPPTMLVRALSLEEPFLSGPVRGPENWLKRIWACQNVRALESDRLEALLRVLDRPPLQSRGGSENYVPVVREDSAAHIYPLPTEEGTFMRFDPSVDQWVPSSVNDYLQAQPGTTFRTRDYLGKEYMLTVLGNGLVKFEPAVPSADSPPGKEAE